jgi:hypothetical protein
VTKSGDQVIFYIDGVASNPVSYNPGFTFTTNAAIGARGDDAIDNSFFGDIDELEIFNRALSQTEIQSIFNASSAGKCKGAAGAVLSSRTRTTRALVLCVRPSRRQRQCRARRPSPSIFRALVCKQSRPLQLCRRSPMQVVIDGYTQPGASVNTLEVGNNAVLLIALSGANAGVVPAGLRITGGGSTVRGLVVNNFTGGFPNANGIQLNGGSGNVIEGNFIGTTPDGTAAALNSVFAVDITNSTNNRIGGTTPAARNLLSGNAEGVHIFNSGGAGNNLVQGNYIGTNAAGTAAIPNSGDAAIRITNSTGNQIGGTTAGAGNVISGNTTSGISIDTSANNNIVQGNRIGTDAAATGALPNTRFGIVVGISSGNQIGATTAGAGNIIANSGDDGVAILSGTGNLVSSNSIFANTGLGIDLGNNGVTAERRGRR